jgi:hypothetical protein
MSAIMFEIMHQVDSDLLISSWWAFWQNLAQNTGNSSNQTSCALDSVGTSTEEVYWLLATQYEYNRRTSTQTLCKTIVVLAQQEHKGKSNNNQTKLITMTKYLYTTQVTGSAIPIGRALRQAILVVYHQPSLNQLDRVTFIVQSNFRITQLNSLFSEVILLLIEKRISERSKSNLGWTCWYFHTRLA